MANRVANSSAKDGTAVLAIFPCRAARALEGVGAGLAVNASSKRKACIGALCTHRAIAQNIGVTLGTLACGAKQARAACRGIPTVVAKLRAGRGRGSAVCRNACIETNVALQADTRH